ncbi:MAG: hypothetical protein WBA46_17480 [Thermomicrobiales bacterium]
MSDRSLLLDTNVLSQVLRSDGDGIVRDPWNSPAEPAATTTATDVPES